MGKPSRRKSFVFNVAWQEVLMEYPPEVRLEVYDAIIRYVASGKLSELKPLAKMAFSFIKNEIDYNSDRYDEMVAKRSEAGKKGMAARYASQTDATNDNKTNTCYQDATELTNVTKLTNVTNVTDNVYDNDNDIKETSSTTKQRKADGDTPREDGQGLQDGETMPLQAGTLPAAQKEKSCAKKEKAAASAVAAPAQREAQLGTEEIIAEIERRAITAEQLAMVNGLDAAGWQAVKAEIFTQWRFEGYRNTLQDALNHFANLVRKKACDKRKAGAQGLCGSVEAMIAGMLATARTPEQEQADDEQFKRDFGL